MPMMFTPPRKESLLTECTASSNTASLAFTGRCSEKIFHGPTLMPTPCSHALTPPICCDHRLWTKTPGTLRAPIETPERKMWPHGSFCSATVEASTDSCIMKKSHRSCRAPVKREMSSKRVPLKFQEKTRTSRRCRELGRVRPLLPNRVNSLVERTLALPEGDQELLVPSRLRPLRDPLGVKIYVLRPPANLDA